MLVTILWAAFLLLIGALAGTFAFVGVCCLIPILRFGWAANASAPATVIGEKVDKNEEGEVDYYPLVEFSVGGKRYQIQGPYGTKGHPVPRVGSATEVHFREDDPQRAELQRFQGAWFALLIVLIAGGMIAGVLRELARLFP